MSSDVRLGLASQLYGCLWVPREPNIQVYKWDGVGPLGECVTEELDGRIQDRHHYPLRLVATELTTQSMVVFPRDADLLYAVRATKHVQFRRNA
jgi:hypothetical protein